MTRPQPKPTTTEETRRWFVASLALVALAAVGPAPAKAAAVQFATFSQTTGTPFEFDNLGTFSTVNFAGSAQTKFNFTAATGLSTANRDATLILSGSTNAPVASFGGFAIQDINGGANTLTIIENSTGLNLLTMVFNGTISGRLGSANATLDGDTDLGNSITYTSDYLTFSGNPASYLIGLPTVTPALSISGNFLTSFASNAQGSFSGSINAVPAPTSMAMFGTGIVATLALAKRRKRLAELKSS